MKHVRMKHSALLFAIFLLLFTITTVFPNTIFASCDGAVNCCQAVQHVYKCTIGGAVCIPGANACNLGLNGTCELNSDVCLGPDTITCASAQADFGYCPGSLACRPGYTKYSGGTCSSTPASPPTCGWTSYGACSKSCGPGVRTRTNTCNGQTQTIACNLGACGNWKCTSPGSCQWSSGGTNGYSSQATCLSNCPSEPTCGNNVCGANEQCCDNSYCATTCAQTPNCGQLTCGPGQQCCNNSFCATSCGSPDACTTALVGGHCSGARVPQSQGVCSAASPWFFRIIQSEDNPLVYGFETACSSSWGADTNNNEWSKGLKVARGSITNWFANDSYHYIQDPFAPPNGAGEIGEIRDNESILWRGFSEQLSEGESVFIMPKCGFGGDGVYKAFSGGCYTSATAPAPKSKSCSVTTSTQSINEGESITFALSAEADYNAIDAVRFFISKPDLSQISPTPTNTVETLSSLSYYYEAIGCSLGGGSRECTTSITIPNLPAGSYNVHCDAPSDPLKCSGAHACDFEGGTVDCTGSNWTSCSDQDNLAIVVQPPPPPPPATPTMQSQCTSESTILLSWPAVPGATSYLLRVDDGVSGDNIQATGYPTDTCLPDADHDVCLEITETSVTIEVNPTTFNSASWWLHAVNQGGISPPTAFAAIPNCSPTYNVSGTVYIGEGSFATNSCTNLGAAVWTESQELSVEVIRLDKIPNEIVGAKTIYPIDYGAYSIPIQVPTGTPLRTRISPITSAGPPQTFALDRSKFDYQCPSDGNFSEFTSDGNNKTFNFFVSENKDAWFQIAGGNVLSNTTISFNIPFETCNTNFGCDPYLISREIFFPYSSITRLPQTAGIPITASPLSTNTSGYTTDRSASSTNAVSPAAAIEGIYDYDYFAELIRVNSVATNITENEFTPTTIQTLSELSGATTVYSDGTEVYKLDYGLVFKPSETFVIDANRKILVFVWGDLTIDGSDLGSGASLTAVQEGSNLVFIVSGDIMITSSVGVEQFDVKDPQLEGIFIASGEIIVESAGGPGEKKFVGSGTFVGQDGIRLLRDFNLNGNSIGNKTSPTELFIHRPDLVLNWPNLLKESTLTWKEAQ